MNYQTQVGQLQAFDNVARYVQNSPDRDNTDLEVIRDCMRERIKHGHEINARLSSLVIKLIGSLPPSGKESGPAAVPNGLIADLQDIAATLESVQATTIDLIGRLTSAV